MLKLPKNIKQYLLNLIGIQIKLTIYLENLIIILKYFLQNIIKIIKKKKLNQNLIINYLIMKK